MEYACQECLSTVYRFALIGNLLHHDLLQFFQNSQDHDKVTGFKTRNAFMSNIVNKANFTNYTYLQEMINLCEELYSEVSARIAQESQQELYEDERLFIEMIQQLNNQRV
jgi:hypothetical protein